MFRDPCSVPVSIAARLYAARPASEGREGRWLGPRKALRAARHTVSAQQVSAAVAVPLVTAGLFPSLTVPEFSEVNDSLSL